jgi:hypothetical protein
MKKVKNWFSGLLRDEKGTPSSKRFVGIVAGLSLPIALFINLFTEYPVDHTIVNTVGLLAFGCLGLSSVDKFTKKPLTKLAASDEEQN